MKQKKMKDVKVVQSISRTKAVCQNCSYHKNNPSTCNVFLEEPRFTGRKETCEFFKS